MKWGLALMTIGMFSKIVIADGLLAGPADTVFGADEMLHPLDAWLGTLAFSGQIFCDFAGYSTTAIGVALTLGFSLPDNFRFPYAAIGFSDFWRRWHISLSTWLRDYLYIPLGGNRKGDLRTYANLMTTMLLGGLWHGASWTFVVWGGLHGLYLAAERWLTARFGGHAIWNRWLARLALALLTYFLINITWVFFRAQDFATAWRLIDTMLTLDFEGKKVLVEHRGRSRFRSLRWPCWPSTGSCAAAGSTRWSAAAPRWLVGACLGHHVMGHRHHPGRKRCLHLLPVLNALQADPHHAGSDVVERAVPALGRAGWIALLVFLAGMAAMESWARNLGVPSGDYRGSPGAWAEQRRRIDQGEGDAWVFIGSSRIYYDLQIPVWTATGRPRTHPAGR